MTKSSLKKGKPHQHDKFDEDGDYVNVKEYYWTEDDMDSGWPGNPSIYEIIDLYERIYVDTGEKLCEHFFYFDPDKKVINAATADSLNNKNPIQIRSRVSQIEEKTILEDVIFSVNIFGEERKVIKVEKKNKITFGKAIVLMVEAIYEYEKEKCMMAFSSEGRDCAVIGLPLSLHGMGEKTCECDQYSYSFFEKKVSYFSDPSKFVTFVNFIFSFVPTSEFTYKESDFIKINVEILLFRTLIGCRTCGKPFSKWV